MEYSDSFEKAAEFAAKAVEAMGRHNVVPNPNNFTVWYHYTAGTYPDLTRTLDILIGNNQDFTEQRCVEIFEKFFTLDNENAGLNDAANKIEQELGRVIGYISDADKGAETYGRSLKTASGALGGGDDTAQSLRSVVDNILSATENMKRQNAQLQNRLMASSSEMTQLKQDLDDMRREAMTDALTGIANRKMFDVTLRKAAMDSMEDGGDLCLLLLDIDHFKKFNDTYGHQVGDQVLKLVAEIMRREVKGQDTPARYGGEEFAVILPSTGLKDAVTLAEHIRQRISQKTVINRKTNEKMGRITLSIGAARFAMGEPLAQLIGRADQALYMAKNAGRNRVISQDQIEAAALSLET